MRTHPDLMHLGNLGRWSIQMRKTPGEFGDLSLEPGALIVSHVDVQCGPFLVRNSGRLAWHYAILSLETSGAPEGSRAHARHLLEAEPRSPDFRRHFDFPDWHIEEYVRLAEDCAGRGFYEPFARESFRFVEEWLTISLGEAVFFNLPGFWPDNLKALHATGALDFIYDDDRMLRTRVGNVTFPVTHNQVRPARCA